MNKSIFDRGVLQYSLDGDVIALFLSIRKATTSTGIHSSSILNCCKKRSKTGGGFKWKFISREKRFFDKQNFVKIKGYDNYYINPNGDIYNYCIKRFIKTKKNLINYNTVILKHEKDSFKYWVDYLVAHHFLPKDSNTNKIYIRHIDGNNSNNHVSNLEWYDRY